MESNISTTVYITQIKLTNNRLHFVGNFGPSYLKYSKTPLIQTMASRIGLALRVKIFLL